MACGSRAGADFLRRKPEEIAERLSRAKRSRVEHAVEKRAEPQRVAQVSGALMLLVGGKVKKRAFVLEAGEVVEQLPVEAGVVFEPIVEQGLGVNMRCNPAKYFRQTGFDRLLARDDSDPVRLEEFLLKQRRRQAEVALEIGKERQAVCRPSVDQHPIDIDHQDFHGLKLLRKRNVF